MPPAEGERIATNAARIQQLFGEMEDRKLEEQRTRKRLHDLEGLMGLMVDQQKQNRRQEAAQYRRLELRIQVMTLAVAVATVITPIALALSHF